MALKEQKLPSPAEITQQAQQQDQQTQQTPQPTQTQGPIKFTQEEMDSLKGLQVKMSQIINAFGQLKVAEIRLKNQKNSLEQQLEASQKEEADLAKTLSAKYGKGSLNAETGEFTPSK